MNRSRFTFSVGKALGALGLLLALGATSGCVVAARGQLRTGSAVAYEAPPEPRYEQAGASARSGHVWIKGRWNWQNGGWEWTPGHWERERAGYGYQDGRWEQRNGQWHWIEGQWTVGATQGQHHDHGRDQDRDHRDGQPGGHVHGQGHPGHGQPGGGTVVVSVGGHAHTPSSAPPPIRVESPGVARGGYVWIRGNWQWSNGQYEWVPGHWERQKAGYQWFDGQWQAQGNGWVWVQGEWRAQGQVGPQTQIRDRRTH